MQRHILRALVFWAAAALASTAGPARAADCGDSPQGFQAWLDDFRQVAINDGVSPEIVDQTLATASFDRSVLAHDQGQAALQGNYRSFASGHITPGRIKQGKTMMLAYAEPLERIEQRFGVPAPVLVAIWGLETDFGASLGRYPTFSALATLAYDCRRGNLYRAELIDAMMIVQRGLLSPHEMRGAWAGELGQTQFMPSAYLKYGVSANGGRGGNLMGNGADALASTANFLSQKGWQRGAGWNEGQPNFSVLLEWNKAPVYAKTIAEFADRLAQ
ncbi:MAG: lytic murein transglycosylase [Hyphomicrobiales bacterium]|nr:lytic murein transglycosylase [Hyphomicrobiales bacterium]